VQIEERRDQQRVREGREGQPPPAIIKAGKPDQPGHEDAGHDDQQRSKRARRQPVLKRRRQADRQRKQNCRCHREDSRAPAKDKIHGDQRSFVDTQS